MTPEKTLEAKERRELAGQALNISDVKPTRILAPDTSLGAFSKSILGQWIMLHHWVRRSGVKRILVQPNVHPSDPKK